MKEDKLISALIGLVGACNNNPKTEQTDRLLIKALAFPVVCTDFDEAELQEMLNEVYAEKHAVAPDCAQCAYPCGNTSDYDMERIYGAAEEIREVKLQIIDELEKLAADVRRGLSDNVKPDMDVDIFYKALSYISYDIGLKELSALLMEADNTETEDKIYINKNYHR